MIELVEKTVNILHIEDKKDVCAMVKTYLKKSTDCKIITQSTILGAKRFLQIEPYDCIDLIICDWMLPMWDAEYIIKDLYSLGKPVIFYTCLEKIEVFEKVKKQLGFIPRNFKYIQKGSERNLFRLSEIIHEECF